jgi:hypothetical protein
MIWTLLLIQTYLNPIESIIKNDSDDTTVSSIISNDNVQSIQKALQQTSIADLERKDGDGHFDD